MQTCTLAPPLLVQFQLSSQMTSRQQSTPWWPTQPKHTKTWWRSTGTFVNDFTQWKPPHKNPFPLYTAQFLHLTYFQYLRNARGDQSSLLWQHHQKTKVQLILKKPQTNISIDSRYLSQYTPREGTGIQKFKRSKWSATDESPPRRRKRKQTQERHISHFFI